MNNCQTTKVQSRFVRQFPLQMLFLAVRFQTVFTYSAISAHHNTFYIQMKLIYLHSVLLDVNVDVLFLARFFQTRRN